MSAPDPARDGNDPLVGKVVEGRFAILEHLAAGGMGVVYKAEQRPLGRVVALKVLESNQSRQVDDSFGRRFFLEASAAAKLAHPNTIVVHDYGKTDDGLYFIAMEYLDGGSLATRLKKQGPLTPAQAIHVGLQVAGSLADAHDQGLVHRDLKPGNVMFAPRAGDPFFAKVLDFGLVKMIGEDKENLALTQSGVMMGSPRYMAPEQVRAQPVDHRADIYAFGAVLYHMVTGAPPFAVGNAFEAMHAHVHTPPPPFRATWPACPAGPRLEAVALRCLAKDPGARFPSMHELMRALRECEGEAGALTSSGGWLGPHVSSASLSSASYPSASMSAAGAPSGARSGTDSNPSISRSGIQASGQRSAHKTMRFEAEPAPSAPVIARPPEKQTSGVVMALAAFAAVVALGGAATVGLVLVGRPHAEPDVVRAPATPAPARAARPREPEPAPAPVARPAPTPPTRAPVEPGVVPLALHSDPPGARVQRDGVDLGNAPVSLPIPRGERWTIDLVLSGYETRTVTLAAGQPELTIHLERELGPRRERPIATPEPQPLAPRPLAPAPRPLVRPPARPGSYAPDLNDPWASQR